MKYIVTILIVIIFAVLSIRTSIRSTDCDFISTYQTAERIINNTEIYRTEDGMHTLMWSPFYASIVIPLGFFSPAVSAVVFFTISFILGLISIYLLYQVFPIINNWYVLIAVLLSGRFLLDNWLYGQINTFILFFISLFLYYGLKHKFVRSHIFLLMAAFIKVFPAFMITIFPKTIIKKPVYIRKSIIGIILGLAIVFAIPVFMFGISGTIHQFYKWYQMLSSSFSRMPLNHYGNQSLTAFITRTFEYSSLYTQIGFKISIIAAISIIIASWKKPTLQRIAIISVACLIASPIVWKHSLVLLLIPNFYIAYRLSKNSLNNLLQIKSIFLLIYIVLAVFTSSGFVGKNISKQLLEYSVLFWAQLSLLIYLLIDKDRLEIKNKTSSCH